MVGLRLQVGGEDAALAAAFSCGMRPRSIRFATSEVMKTVLPARLRPVTPSRTTGSQTAPLDALERLLDLAGDAVGQAAEVQRAPVLAGQGRAET